MAPHDTSPDPEPLAARVLAELPRREAPAELDGRVVAALESGHRQERAVSALRVAGPLRAPAELDDRIAAALDPHAAPRVLGRLVDERVAAPEATLVRSMLGRLERRRAPGELDARVAAATEGGAVDARRYARRTRWGLALAAAAAVLLSLPLVRARLLPEPEPNGSSAVRRAPLARDFEFVGHASFADVPWTTEQRALAAGLAGEPIGGGS